MAIKMLIVVVGGVEREMPVERSPYQQAQSLQAQQQAGTVRPRPYARVRLNTMEPDPGRDGNTDSLVIPVTDEEALTFWARVGQKVCLTIEDA